jgi:hypothetical protein
MFAPETFEECVICGGQIRTVYGSAEWHEENGGIPDNECHCAEPITAIDAALSKIGGGE